MVSGIEFDCGGRPLVFSASRAAFCPGERILFVADVHLGKATSFRSLGVPVPSGTTAATLQRLDDVIDAFNPQTLVVLGDLLHGPAVQGTSVIDALRDWRHKRQRIDVILVRGNHDLRAGDPPAECGVTLVDEGAVLGGWRLFHAPPEPNDAYEPQPFGLAGHVHPCFRLTGRADSVRLPAFWLRADHAILPAFGEFTGGWQPPRLPGDRVVISDGELLREIPAKVVSELVRT